MSDNKQSKCIVYYKVGISGSGTIYGIRFYDLVKCCAAFSIWFHRTGNSKSTNFNFIDSDKKSGFNLVSRGGSLRLVLKQDESALENEIKFCSFCGAEVELVEARRVKLVSISEQVHAFWQEEIISKNPDVPPASS